MKLKKPKKTDYDFYAIVVNGEYLDHLVYVDDTDDDGFVCYLLDRNGEWSYSNGNILFKRKDLLKLPYSMGMKAAI